MSQRDRKLRKKKARQERIRQEKHLRRSQPRVVYDEVDEPEPEDLEWEEDEPGSMALPSPFMMERMHHQTGALMKDRNIESQDDMNQILMEFNALFEADRQKLWPNTPAEHAQELAYQALEADSFSEMVRLARQALELDPDCVDALQALAMGSTSEDEDLVPKLERAVAAGERVLGAEFFKENKGRFWGIVATRPYMRARAELARALERRGRKAEAIEHLEGMLELNPNDNQGLRGLLLGAYLATDNLQGARRVLKEYEGDPGAALQWGRVLERYLAGRPEEARQALKEAYADNPYVLEFLTGEGRGPQDARRRYSHGSPAAARICFAEIGDAWVKHPEALAWLWEWRA